ncbi:MAG: hypothetical protein MZU95_16505 [Desulfomicrobium escambiense]|nr:hypothetical protein [Desulfomicrobium escambiense]
MTPVSRWPNAACSDRRRRAVLTTGPVIRGHIPAPHRARRPDTGRRGGGPSRLTQAGGSYAFGDHRDSSPCAGTLAGGAGRPGPRPGTGSGPCRTTWALSEPRRTGRLSAVSRCGRHRGRDLQYLWGLSRRLCAADVAADWRFPQALAAVSAVLGLEAVAGRVSA